ncbi:MAG: GTPase HflX [Corallococcus sp.]|nr:GTPase HflX [Corallococcus sp.]MCM1359168.1 GTPase HflX [Corallococcus sp.]MCM1394558.1 GTPase HflX [Corallococcus sp.]
MTSNDKIRLQNVALVFLERPDSSAEEEISELKELIRSAMGEVRLLVRQNRNFADPKTLIGSGKVTELKAALETLDCKIDVVIFSDKLNALQRKNLQKELDIAVIDYVDLILDIFALRATTAEGKKQVELAQLSYSLATRPEKDYSRQGAGIGTRGPGETQLETDKRVARNKMHRLRLELQQIAKQRATTRKKRLENNVYTVALAGYTNAGKSTLFNLLTDNNVYADDRLFATLDTTIRKVKLDGIEILFCDTVGFIRNLPTLLVDAFKSTLEEVSFADLILNVCDVSDPNVENQKEVTERVLAELNANSPVVRVFNKCDKLEKSAALPYFAGDAPCVYVSAVTGKNIDVLKDIVEKNAKRNFVTIKLKVPYCDNGTVASLLKKYASELTVEYGDEYAFYTASIQRKYLNSFAQYMVI